MPKGKMSKLKLYYLSRIMLEKTDDDHALSMPQIQKELSRYGVTADRKSLYDDMEALKVLGIDVIGEKHGLNYTYHVGKKNFDLAELKLLVDAIQSSKFITEKKSNDLIKKITSLCSNYEASQLKRQVVVHGRVKTMNESIYYLVDDIHRAIAENRQISFKYMRWTKEKKMVSRKEGLYKASPWALTWDDENYYMIAYDSEDDIIKHFRVDKMKSITILDEDRDGRKTFEGFDLAGYSKMNFGMYHGNVTSVRMVFKDELVGVFLDRFGKDIPISEAKDPGWSETRVTVAVSNQFFGWVFALGTDVKILGPKEVADQLEEEAKEIVNIYMK
jgi:predicted DNA-binding transcriptional regulator YafY